MRRFSAARRIAHVVADTGDFLATATETVGAVRFEDRVGLRSAERGTSLAILLTTPNTPGAWFWALRKAIERRKQKYGERGCNE